MPLGRRGERGKSANPMRSHIIITGIIIMSKSFVSLDTVHCYVPPTCSHGNNNNVCSCDVPKRIAFQKEEKRESRLNHIGSFVRQDENGDIRKERENKH